MRGVCLRRQWWAWLAGASAAVLVGYGLCQLACYSIREARAAATMMSLANIWRASVEFESKHARWATDLGELGLQDGQLIDLISGRRFGCAQILSGQGKAMPIVWQPEPYRTALWPFGKMKQWALYSDGSVRDLLTEYAARRGVLLEGTDSSDTHNRPGVNERTVPGRGRSGCVLTAQCG